MICLPSLFDVKQYHDYLEDKSKNSEEGLKGPVEPLQIDENYDARKARRILRKVCMRCLQRLFFFKIPFEGQFIHFFLERKEDVGYEV